MKHVKCVSFKLFLIRIRCYILYKRQELDNNALIGNAFILKNAISRKRILELGSETCLSKNISYNTKTRLYNYNE
jgi:hypothetical protein